MRTAGYIGRLFRSTGWVCALIVSATLQQAKPAFERNGVSSAVTYKVKRANSEITVDGALNEAAWSEALALELSYEVRPGENIVPPVRTELLVTYDDRRVYFAFRAYDPDPRRIRARYSDRDKAWDDDFVGVALDTFNDERRAYELLSNPLGVQMDALNDDVLQNYDHSWNAIWDSAGRITEQGYQVEMAVPFNQIRFQASNGDSQTWGFDAFRSYPRSNRHHIGLFPRDRGNNSYLSQMVKIEGMEGADPGKNLELIPTLTASRTDERSDLSDGELTEGETDPELGATVRWGITPNVSLNGAVNPDFSQVEADVLRLNINEQFTLFFPETRPFFLEGADYFSTPINLVHTRVIVEPKAAGKVTGKENRNTFGLFSAHDATTTMIFPGAEGSSSDKFEELETTNTVGRYRFDFGRNSTVGAVLTDRRGGDYYNQVASIDANYRITEADRITASIGYSNTQYSDEMIEAARTDEDVSSDGALCGDVFCDGAFSDPYIQLEYLHTTRNWWIVADYNDFGEGFRADMGFVPQVDYKEWYTGGAKIWWGEEGQFYNRMAWGAGMGHSERQNGDLLNERIESWFNLNGPKQSHFEVNAVLRNQMYDNTQFDDQLFAHTWFEFQPADDLWLAFHQDYGDWIDYANTQPAKRTLIQPRLRYNLGRHFLVNYIHTYSALDVEGGRLFRAHAPELRFIYQFNTRAFIRTILQYTDIERNPSLYIDEVDPESKDLFTQLLFTYKVNAQTAIYAGYSDEYQGDIEYDMTQTSRSLFIKLSYAWVR